MPSRFVSLFRNGEVLYFAAAMGVLMSIHEVSGRVASKTPSIRPSGTFRHYCMRDAHCCSLICQTRPKVVKSRLVRSALARIAGQKSLKEEVKEEIKKNKD